jgi:hypothetical protein
MAAPATTAPFGSVTLPVICPVSLWARIVPAITAIANTTDRNARPVVAACLELVLLIVNSFLELFPEIEKHCLVVMSVFEGPGLTTKGSFSVHVFRTALLAHEGRVSGVSKNSEGA